MTDIVERLRVIAEYQLEGEGFYTHAEEVRKAADEIERLREALEHYADRDNWDGEIARAALQKEKP